MNTEALITLVKVLSWICLVMCPVLVVLSSWAISKHNNGIEAVLKGQASMSRGFFLTMVIFFFAGLFGAVGTCGV